MLGMVTASFRSASEPSRIGTWLIALVVAVLAWVGGPPEAAARDTVVRLEGHRGGERVQCIGALLTPDRVLTAAHCLDRVTAVTVRSQQGDERVARRWIVHPAYPAEGADLAVLVLAKGLPTPGAPMTMASDLPARGGRLTVWRPVERHVADVGAVVARSADDEVRIIAPTTNGFCQGQSGGPAIDARGRLVGVVSRGEVPLARSADEGPRCGLIAVVLTLAPHASWLAAALN